MPIESEHEAASSLPAGAAEATRLLYPRLGEAVYQTIDGVVLDAEQARDLTREAFARAYREWDGTAAGTDTRLWLLGIAADLAVTWCRTHSQTNADGERDLAVRLLRPLTPEQRALITLHHVQGLASGELAQALGIPEDSVAPRLNRAMQTLRRSAVEGATDAAIIDGLNADLRRRPRALPPINEILSTAEPAGMPPVAISLIPPGRAGAPRRPADTPLSRRLPYLVAVAAAVLLVGLVVVLNLHAAYQGGGQAGARGAAAQAPATPSNNGGLTPTPTPVPTPTPPPPTPVATAPPTPPPPTTAPAPPPPTQPPRPILPIAPPHFPILPTLPPHGPRPGTP